MNEEMNFNCMPFQCLKEDDAWIFAHSYDFFHKREFLNAGLDAFLAMVCADANLLPEMVVRCIHALLVNSVYFYKTAGLDQFRVELSLNDDEA